MISEQCFGEGIGDKTELSLRGNRGDVLRVFGDLSVTGPDWFDTTNFYLDYGVPQSSTADAALELEKPPLVGSLMLSADGGIEVVTNVLHKNEHDRYPVYTTKAKVPRTQQLRVSKLIAVRVLTRNLLEMEAKEGTVDATLTPMRDELNRYYDNFIAEYGYLNNKNNRRWLRQDAEGAFLLGLEIYDPEEERAEKSTIFSERCVNPPKEITAVDNLRAAVSVSYSKYGYIDPDAISGLLSKPFKQALLDEPGVLLKNPESDIWELREVYLSGNVRKKLAIALKAASENSDYDLSVEHLQSVMPIDIPAEDILVSLSSHWIPASYFSDFTQQMYAGHGVTATLEIERIASGDIRFEVNSYHGAGRELIDRVENELLVAVTK